MITDPLSAEITDLEAIEAFPVGAILLEHVAQHPGEAMAWRKEFDGYWYPSTFSWIRPCGALAMAGKEPTLIWLPPEASKSDAPPVHGMFGGHYQRIQGGEVYVAACGTVGATPLTGLWGSITCDGCVEALS